MKSVEKAVQSYSEEFNCSQAILSAYAEEFGLDNANALKVLSAFGGGISRNGKICGALTGALMVIGLKYWISENSREEAKTRVYDMSNRLLNEFKERNQTVNCEELLGINVSTAEGRAVVKEKNLNVSVCHKVIYDTCEILDKLL